MGSKEGSFHSMTATISRSVPGPGLMRFVLLLGLLQTLFQVPGRSVAAQYSELNTLALRVAEPLKNGLSSFNTVSEMLLSMNTDIIPSGSDTFNNVREVVMQMKKNLEESEQIVSTELNLLDVQTESLTAKKSLLEREKEKREAELEESEIKLNSFRSALRVYNQALSNEQRNLNSAQWTLTDMRNKRDEAERLRNAGIGIIWIPIVGWIAGSIMVGVGQTDLDSASEQVDRAQREIQNCESQIRFYSQQVSYYEGLVSKAHSDIQEVKSSIWWARVKLVTLSVERGLVADLQSKTRRAVYQVGLLCGVGSVAELQTRHLILLEVMMKVMEEMLAVLGQITGGDLLHTEDMRRIISAMRNNHRRLEAEKGKYTSGEDYLSFS